MVVKINGKSVNIPQSFESLKTRQYEKILTWDRDKKIEQRDYFKLFCILADKEFAGIESNAINQYNLWQCVRWVLEDRLYHHELSKVFIFKGEKVDIPNKIQLLSIGQNIHARQILDKSTVIIDENGSILDCDCYSMLVAIYLQPIIDNSDFDFAKAEKISKGIAEMPITEVRPLGFFLLKTVLKSGKKLTKTLHLTQISRWQQLKQTLLGSLK